jgi:hypothetical protein
VSPSVVASSGHTASSTASFAWCDVAATSTRARTAYDELRATIPPQRIAWSALTDMGAAIGVHGGPGTLIVAVQRLED